MTTRWYCCPIILTRKLTHHLTSPRWFACSSSSHSAHVGGCCDRLWGEVSTAGWLARDGSKTIMSELLVKEMENVSLCHKKKDDGPVSSRSFLLVDEQENLQVRLANTSYVC